MDEGLAPNHLELILEGIVIQGHGVASGQGQDERYPNGTLSLQWPYFESAGVPINNLFLGTLNVDIHPLKYRLIQPAYKVLDVNWSKYIPPENFFFMNVELLWKQTWHKGLVYMPDPSTKSDHPQPDHMLEIIIPFTEGIRYGSKVKLKTTDRQLLVE